MIVLNSSIRSVNNQSSLRGKMAVSRDMTSLLWPSASPRNKVPTDLLHRDIQEHISRPLHAEEFARDPHRV